MGGNVLITGAGGFLGKYILEALSDDFKVYTLGRTAVGENHISVDLKNADFELPKGIHFQKVIHVAGKAHMIPKTEAEVKDFFDVNEEGTKNLLHAIDLIGSENVEELIYISTVAVYGEDFGELISEALPPNPKTPYGKSKWKGEVAVENWANKNKRKYLILRPPLIVGQNAPGNLGAIKNAILKGYYFKISGNQARKSVVLAQDIAELISKPVKKSGVYNITDGNNPKFSEIENAISIRTGKKIKVSLPLFFLNTVAKIGDAFVFLTKKQFPLTSLTIKKMTTSLTFDSSKAKRDLDWNPNPVLKFIEKEL